MKATKDKDGKIVWEHEKDNYVHPFQRPPMEKIQPAKTKLDELKEKAKTLPQEDEAGS